MLLVRRRTALIHLCQAGMDAAWLTPLWLLIYRPTPGPAAAYCCLLAGLLAWILLLDLISLTEVQSPVFELITLGLMLATSLLFVRVVIYVGTPAHDFRWLFWLVRDTLDFRGGFPPGLALVLANLVLWQRATSATSRDLSFFNVGVSFRLGMLLLIGGAGAVGYLRRVDLTAFLWLYFGLGLTAVAIARINEKAIEAESAGVPLSPARLAQLLLSVGVAIGIVALLSSIYTSDGIRGFLKLFEPLWVLLRPLVFALLLFLVRALAPFFLWLEAQLMALLRGRPPVAIPELTPPITPGSEHPNLFEQLPPWLSGFVLDLLIALGILLAVLMFFGFLLLYLEKVRRESGRREGETEGAESMTFGGGIIGRGVESLRGLAGLVRRFGLSYRLLAAISVQNIYANLSRLARQRGFGRRPAQPPDSYLPILARAFPGQEERLARITDAYMRVHYGDLALTRDELAQLQEDYRQVCENQLPEQVSPG